MTDHAKLIEQARERSNELRAAGSEAFGERRTLLFDDSSRLDALADSLSAHVRVAEAAQEAWLVFRPRFLDMPDTPIPGLTDEEEAELRKCGAAMDDALDLLGGTDG